MSIHREITRYANGAVVYQRKEGERMLRLKIESGRIFLDEKELTGVKELDLHIAGNYPPELKLVMNLDPELLIDQTCDHAGGN